MTVGALELVRRGARTMGRGRDTATEASRSERVWGAEGTENTVHLHVPCQSCPWACRGPWRVASSGVLKDRGVQRKPSASLGLPESS